MRSIDLSQLEAIRGGEGPSTCTAQPLATNNPYLQGKVFTANCLAPKPFLRRRRTIEV